MRLFLLVPVLSACLVVHSQPTIGTADLPQGGTVYLRANAVPPFNADDINNDGENVTWNFSDLVGTDDVDTEYFPMGSASFTTQLIFSSADHFTALDLPDFGADLPIPISGATVYREFGGNAYKTVGIGLTTDFIDLPVPFTNRKEWIPSPW